MPRVLSRLVLAATLAGAMGCRAPDPYYRHGQPPDATASDDVPTADAGDSGRPSVVGDCATCAVRVDYTCRTADVDARAASFVLDVTNQSDAKISLADLTLRYWYTSSHKPQALDCDTAKLGCANVVTSSGDASAQQPKFQDVEPPRPLANEYVEIAFTLGALSLDPGLDTGDTQLRLHNADLSAIDQSDDYSFWCSPQGVAFPSNLVTAYVRGVLVWGLEPPR
ncbi:MAG TPA: cellulose binding domain-containing protein [Polyangia bacterium]|nr:cellulose binding domain-containing protein [Polyangia bacterium]